MKFLILALTFVCSVGFAAKPTAKKVDPNPVYDINAVVNLDGVKSNPRFKLRNGGTAELTINKNQFTEVTINKLVLDGKPSMQMEFVIGKIDSFGGKTIIATPKIIANLGEKSSIMIGGKNLIVSATATKSR